MAIASHMLQGIRVVSIEQYISGPYCTQILADAGAEVVKVEVPGRGDPRRTYEPMVGGGDGLSGGFASYNRGKKSVTLDLAESQDNETFGRLLEDADVLVSNLRPGALTRLGWDAASLRRAYPRLIFCEISGFGASGGPFSSWPAFDSVIQAMSGMSSLIGPDPEGPPGLAPMSTMDILAGTWAALGVLAALVSRARTGEGCHVDTAMYDVGVAFMERPLTLHEFTGESPSRGTDRFSPVGAFRAADGGWVSIVIPTDEMWLRCCEAIAEPDFVNHPDLDTVMKRAEKMSSHIIPALETWAAANSLGRDEAAARLRAHGQPAGAVQSIEEVRDCPHLEHRGMFVPLEDDRAQDGNGLPFRLSRLPLLIDGTRSTPGRVPDLGEHNDEILGALRGESGSS